MSYYNQGYGQNPGGGGGGGASSLQFYPSSYSNVSGHTTPSQASYGGYGSGNTPSGYSGYGAGSSAAFGAGPGMAGVSGRMGESGGLRTGWLAAFGTEGYDGEPGLMEELGVNFGHIKTKVSTYIHISSLRTWSARYWLAGKRIIITNLINSLQTIAVLNPWTRPSPHIMDDSDLYGGLLFLVLYGTFLALSGKFFYGYIYGIALFGSMALHWMFALMTPPIDPADSDHQMAQAQRDHGDGSTSRAHGSGQGHGGHFSSTLTYSRSASVLGYCFLPLVFTALFGVALPMDTAVGYFMTACAVGWCTFSSSGLFVSVGRMKGMRGLVAYPLALFYVGFGIMGIFSSRGSGMLEGKVL